MEVIARVTLKVTAERSTRNDAGLGSGPRERPAGGVHRLGNFDVAGEGAEFGQVVGAEGAVDGVLELAARHGDIEHALPGVEGADETHGREERGGDGGGVECGDGGVLEGDEFEGSGPAAGERGDGAGGNEHILGPEAVGERPRR